MVDRVVGSRQVNTDSTGDQALIIAIFDVLRQFQLWDFNCVALRCPRHVGRNYVPLLCGVDTALRYYVTRDVIFLQIMCFPW